MKLITISGLDGSGKSTQIQLLKAYLESQGKKVFYFHAVEQSLAKKIVDFRNKYCLICKLLGKCEVYKEKSVTRANPFQIFLRKIFLPVDIVRFRILKKKLLQKKYDFILSDRYFYDSLINIRYLEKSEEGKDCCSEDFLSLFKIPVPDTAFYLEISPESILSRKRVPDQGIAYLEKKKTIYEKNIYQWNMKVIDGSRDKEAVFEEIKKELGF